MAVNRTGDHSAAVEGSCNLSFVRSSADMSRIAGDESVFRRKIAAPFAQHHL